MSTHLSVCTHTQAQRDVHAYIHTCTHRDSVYSSMHAMHLYTHMYTYAHVNTCEHMYRFACRKKNTRSHTENLGFLQSF